MGWKRKFEKRSSEHRSGTLPQPLKWRPRVRWTGVITGAIGGIGGVVLIQQYGIRPLSRAMALQGLIGGAISGILVPSAIWALVVITYNRRLSTAGSGHPGSPSRLAKPAAVVALTTVMFTGVGVLTTEPAAADLSGPCSATANGQDVRSLPIDPEQAIQLGETGALEVSAASVLDVDTFEIGIKYFGQIFIVARDTSGDAGSGGLTLSFDNDDLAVLGAGLYEFYGFAQLEDGGACTGAFLFNVDADPLDTIAGRTAAGMTALGAAGLLGMSISGAREGSRYLRDLQSVLVDIDGDGHADGTGFDLDGDGQIDAIGLDEDGDGRIDVTVADTDGDGDLDRMTGVSLRLTHPAGRSPKVFDQGWIFGTSCIVSGENGEQDLSETVRWSGTGKFSPPVGGRSRPHFHASGPNAITLTVTVAGEEHERTFPVVAVSAYDYVEAGSPKFQAEASVAMGCPACPHPVTGPLTTGSPHVLGAHGLPAGRVGDHGIAGPGCGPNQFTVADGDPQVLIDGRPAARRGSTTHHGGGTGSLK